MKRKYAFFFFLIDFDKEGKI